MNKNSSASQNLSEALFDDVPENNLLTESNVANLAYSIRVEENHIDNSFENNEREYIIEESIYESSSNILTLRNVSKFDFVICAK